MQALVSDGQYKYLDVRPQIEFEDVGKVTGSINVPIMYGRKKWSSKKQKKVGIRASPEGSWSLVSTAAISLTWTGHHPGSETLPSCSGLHSL